MSVPSIEKTIEWYERVMGWKGHFDVFDEDGKCSYGSVSGGKNHFFNLSRVRFGEATKNPAPFVTFYVHVKDVDAAYKKVVDSRWEVLIFVTKLNLLKQEIDPRAPRTIIYPSMQYIFPSSAPARISEVPSPSTSAIASCVMLASKFTSHTTFPFLTALSNSPSA